MAVSRDSLKVDRLYLDRSNDLVAYTPDGVGIIWYDSIKEAQEDTGITTPVIHVSEILDY